MIGAELTTATTLEERMAALWRNVADPVAGDGRWIALEHELWSYAARNEAARAHLAAPLPGGVGRASSAARRLGRRRAGAGGVGPAVIGLLLGLEMMRRVDPDAVHRRPGGRAPSARRRRTGVDRRRRRRTDIDEGDRA